MDIDRMTPAVRLSLCRKYFIFGIFGLPFLWLVNTIWFGNFVFIQKGEPKKRRNGGSAQQSQQAQTLSQVGSQSRVTGPSGQPSTSTGGSSSSTTTRQRHVPEARENPPAPGESPETEDEKRQSLEGIRRYVIFSFVGTALWAIGIIAWVIIFQLKRAEWGEFGDSISFNIPRGIP